MDSPVRMTPLKELLETEESFVETLRFLVNNVLQPLEAWLTEVSLTLDQDPNRKEKNSMYNIIKKENIDIIPVLFSNIKQILDINTYILELFQEANGERLEVVKQFKKVAPSLKFYSDYIRKFETARLLLKRLMQDIRFATFIRALELQPFSGGQALESHLAKPWQRVMKYELLLKEIKKSAESEEEITLISKLILDMKLINHGMNRSQAATQNQKLLMDKQKYYGMSDLTKPARYFVKDGDLKVIKEGKKKVMSFILCNDALIWGRKQNMIQYANFREHDINTIQVIRKKNDKSRSFILLLSAEESIQVECDSILDCEEWLSELISLKTDEHLENFTGRKDTRRVSVQKPKGLTDFGESKMRIFEFIYDDEAVGSANGTFFNNLYDIPFEATVNANSLGYIPYDDLVRLDEDKSRYGGGDEGDDITTTTGSDSTPTSDMDRESSRITSLLFGGSGMSPSASKNKEEEEDFQETLKANSGGGLGVHSVSITDDLLAEALKSSPAPSSATPHRLLSKGVSCDHDYTTTTNMSPSTSQGTRPSSLQVSHSDSSLLQHQHQQSRPQQQHPPQQVTPPRIQPSSAHIAPTPADISPSILLTGSGTSTSTSSHLPTSHMSMSVPRTQHMSVPNSAHPPQPSHLQQQNYNHHSQQRHLSMPHAPSPHAYAPTSSPPPPPVMMGFPEKVSPPPAPLPYGWEQKRSPDGRLYYIHHASKTTQWMRPQHMT